MVYELLLDQLYGEEGYYLDYSDKYDVICDVLDGLQGKYQPTAETVEEIIECLVACGLFSGDQFKRKTITSHRAQCVYYTAVATRKAVDIDFSKWLLTEAEMKKLSPSGKHIILLNFVNRPINSINKPNNANNQSIKPQSKVEESILDDDEAAAGPSGFESFLNDFVEVFFIPNRIQRDHLQGMFEQYGEFEVNEAFEATAKRNVGNPIDYIRTVLENNQLKKPEE